MCVCPQVYVQVVDIFDNAEVVMSKFIQSLLERVLQVNHSSHTWHVSLQYITIIYVATCRSSYVNTPFITTCLHYYCGHV